MDAPIGDHEALTLGDLLPDLTSPADAAAEADFADIAAKLAREILHELDSMQRVILTAYALLLPLSHPAVTAAAGRQKCVICSRSHSLAQELAVKVIRKFPEESEAACFYLTRHLMKTLKEHCLATIHSMPGGPEMAQAAEEYHPEPEPEAEEA